MPGSRKKDGGGEHPVAALLTRFEANWAEAATSESTIVVACQRLARLFNESRAQSLAPFNLMATEFEVLAALRSSPGPHRLIPTDLYEVTMLTSGGLTPVLKRLETRGLVNRPKGVNGRSKPVELSPAGASLVDDAMSRVQISAAALLDGAFGPDGNAEALERELMALLSLVEARRGGERSSGTLDPINRP